MKRAALLPDAEVPPLDGVIPAWPGESLNLDGTATFVRHTPATSPGAEPALYVHGLGGSSLNWTDLAFLLSDRLDGHAIDLPGFGYSDPGRSYGIPAMARRVISLIEQADRGPVHLFGNSLGGAITVRVAATRADLVRSLTLISPAMPFMDPRRSLQSRLIPLLFVPGGERLAARRLATIAPEVLAAQVVAACFARPDLLAPQRMEEAIEEVRRRYEAPWYVAAYLRTFRGLVTSFLRSYLPGENSLWRLAARITAPTLVITGRQDRLVDVRVAPAVAKIIPDSRLLVLDRVGHVAQMEKPRAVARAVGAMLDELAGSPSLTARSELAGSQSRTARSGSDRSGTGPTLRSSTQRSSTQRSSTQRSTTQRSRRGSAHTSSDLSRGGVRK
jgi:pimeloyl-ACP methyl ester carboxylesterase